MASVDIAALLEANAADEATQNARRGCLKGKRILWLTCFYTANFFEGLRPAIQPVVDAGARLFVVFSPSETDRGLCARMASLGMAAEDDAIFCDLEGGDVAQRVLQAAQAKGVTFDAVFSPHEHCQTLVGELVDALKLPGNTRKSYISARDKSATRDACRAAGVPAPLYARINDPEELKDIGHKIGYPVVIKPTSGAASAGVYKCENYDELLARYNILAKDLTQNPFFCWNPGCTLGVLVESYIDGDEFDVDLLLWDSKLVFGGCNDNWATMEPTFLETGSNSPSIHPAANCKELIAYAYECVMALGFVQGCFHVECKYTIDTMLRVGEDGAASGQPMLLEVNPRMGGGRTRLFYKEVYGVDLFEDFVLSSCGIPINPPRSEEPLCGVVDYFFCAEKTGVLIHNRFLDHIRGHPNVTACVTIKNAGDHVKGCDRGVPDWVGFITLKCDTVDDGLDLMNQFIQSVELPIMPDGVEKEVSAPDQVEVVELTTQ